MIPPFNQDFATPLHRDFRAIPEVWSTPILVSATEEGNAFVLNEGPPAVGKTTLGLEPTKQR